MFLQKKARGLALAHSLAWRLTPSVYRKVMRRPTKKATGNRASWSEVSSRLPFKTSRKLAALATCCACMVLRHFVPQNHDLWAAVNLWFNGVCKVKNRLIGDFLMFFARGATNSWLLTGKRHR
ncbi:MAG: hypothetical protein LBK73_10130 [Treponema sp.]|jgi:hypothetical protein|nr:hypothetical protein [Treponema sp.]